MRCYCYDPEHSDYPECYDLPDVGPLAPDTLALVAVGWLSGHARLPATPIAQVVPVGDRVLVLAVCDTTSGGYPDLLPLLLGEWSAEEREAVGRDHSESRANDQELTEQAQAVLAALGLPDKASEEAFAAATKAADCSVW